MSYCVVTDGVYCNSVGQFVLSDNLVPLNVLVDLTVYLLSVSFSLSNHRSDCYSHVTSVINNSYFNARVNGLFVNCSVGQPSIVISNLLLALTFDTRTSEKSSKFEVEEDTKKGNEENSWTYDDASTAFFKSQQALNNIVNCETYIYNRNRFEKEFNLKWRPEE